MADDLLGKLVWCELLTNDVDAAKAFYSSIVGWRIEPAPGGVPGYNRLLNAAGQAMGGLMTIPVGMNYPPHWVMYIATPKLEDTVAEVTRRGGKTLSPVIDVPTIARLQTMLDPQGAMFDLIEPLSSERTPDQPAGIGDVAWRELYTNDAPAAMQFYSEVFGWQETSAFDMGPMGKYYMFGRAFPLGGMMTKTADMSQMPSAWGLYFRVPNVDAGAEQVKARGGQVINGPMDVPGGDRIAQCVDPQGAMFSLHQPASGT
jgi:predicted enzyme related to lactoylglutathione lyase